jgi:hypothetical protein
MFIIIADSALPEETFAPARDLPDANFYSEAARPTPLGLCPDNEEQI